MDWFELGNRLLSLPVLKKRNVQLHNMINDAGCEVSSLLEEYERERRDVDRVLKDSFSTFLLKLTGRYEDRLDKEQREEIFAKLRYDKAETHLESLKKEKMEIESRIFDLEAEQKIYKTELEKRREEIAARMSKPEIALYSEIENEHAEIILQMTEVRQAMTVAENAKRTALSALQSLDRARNWAAFDIVSRRGIISHIAKYSHIDNAEEEFNILSSQLWRLAKELKDIKGLSVPKLSGLSEISSAQRGIDFWFDNIFTDLSVHGKVANNAEEMKNVTDSVNRIISVLKSKQAELEKELANNRRREEELLFKQEGI